MSFFILYCILLKNDSLLRILRFPGYFETPRAISNFFPFPLELRNSGIRKISLAFFVLYFHLLLVKSFIKIRSLLKKFKLVPSPLRAIQNIGGGLELSAIGEYSRQAWQVTSDPKSPRTTGNEAVCNWWLWRQVCFSLVNHASTNLKKVLSCKLDKFTLFTHSLVVITRARPSMTRANKILQKRTVFVFTENWARDQLKQKA